MNELPALLNETQSPATASTSTRKHRVFILDDHPITCRGVAALLSQEADLSVCGQAESAPKALEMIQKLRPDLAIVDISLKSASGLEFVKNARALLPDLLVLVMSMYDEHLYAERALRAGARGYVMKHELSDKILAAIRAILQGNLYLSGNMRESLLNRLVSNKTDDTQDAVERLSDREMEVFELIGDGYTTRQIAERLGLSVKTIDTYREHLKLKLRIARGTELRRHAILWTKSKHFA